MINLKVAASKKDLLEAAMIERRRRFENERKQRIFNARERIIGVDKQSLENQIVEKQQILQGKAEEDRKIQAEQERHNQIVHAKEREMIMEKRRIFNEINEFRTMYQRPEDRREFDLYDPNGKKKDLPARIADTDPRLTISSAQRFEGEDLFSNERKRAQINQQKAWLEQQMKERNDTIEERQAAERLQQEALIAREKHALELAQNERMEKLELMASINAFNKNLAVEQANQRRLKYQQEQDDNLAEQLNHITSDILTESPDAEKSSFGSHRIVPYSYRRMNPGQVDELKNGQIQQFKEIKQDKADQETVQQQWDIMANNFTRTMTLVERDEMRKRREMLSKIRQENQDLADEQQRSKKHIDKVIYTNVPNEAYYQMFNTTSR